MELVQKDAELVIGLVARIGVDTKSLLSWLTRDLVNYGYNVEEVHVTDLLAAFSTNLRLESFPTEVRYKSYIEACNKLRTDIDDRVMAYLALTGIVSGRSRRPKAARGQSRVAYVINQIKRPEEFELLRGVYGEHYVQISCHADETIRVQKLVEKISQDHPESPISSSWEIEARKLVAADESQEDEVHGQRVRQVFPLSDVVIDATDAKVAQQSLERFFRALFGDKSVTPTREEYGMELANTASQRSSDLSRQVGAAILSSSMSIKALGCNEVPKALGGTYWEGDTPDARDFAKGFDSNEQRRRAVLLDLVFRVKEAGGLSTDLSTHDDIKRFLFDRADSLISDSQLMDSLEYGRTVHAEMNALTDAARNAHSVHDCTLYCNTFPCHNCAKHIVAAGISMVIYNHPYPKSYARELFADSIIINPGTTLSVDKINTPEKVIFRQFIGILGPMYARVFTKARWKKTEGSVVEFSKKEAYYIRRTPIPPYLITEELVLGEFTKLLDKRGYNPPAHDD